MEVVVVDGGGRRSQFQGIERVVRGHSSRADLLHLCCGADAALNRRVAGGGGRILHLVKSPVVPKKFFLNGVNTSG